MPVIQRTMRDYLDTGVLAPAVKDGMVLLERTTQSGKRLGLVMAVDKQDAGAVVDALIRCGERPHIIGRCAAGEKGVELW